MASRGPRHVTKAALVATVLAVLVTVLASACQSSDSDEPAAPEPSESSSSTESVSTPKPVPTVEPADGVLLDVPAATMRALDSYHLIADFGIIQAYGDGQSAVMLGTVPTDAKSLAAFANQYIRSHGGKEENKRLEDVVVGGTYNSWHVLNTSDPSDKIHVFGVMFLDGAWKIEVTFFEDAADPRPLAEKKRQGVIDSLLATFKTHRENLR